MKMIFIDNSKNNLLVYVRYVKENFKNEEKRL